MIIALLVLAIVAVALIAALDRMHARQAAERASHRAELAGVLQRVQAPHAAVSEHHAAAAPPRAPENAMPMSDDEIAAGDQQLDPEARRLIEQMEAVENGRLALMNFPDHAPDL